MSVLAPYCSQAPAVADEAPAAHQGGSGMAAEPNETPDSDQDDDAPEIADESDCESLLMSDEDPEQEGEEEEGSGASGGKGSSSRGGKGGGKGRNHCLTALPLIPRSSVGTASASANAKSR